MPPIECNKCGEIMEWADRYKHECKDIQNVKGGENEDSRKD
jgi:hypothetical protein